jgi:hypothetical protein
MKKKKKNSNIYCFVCLSCPLLQKRKKREKNIIIKYEEKKRRYLMKTTWNSYDTDWAVETLNMLTCVQKLKIGIMGHYLIALCSNDTMYMMLSCKCLDIYFCKIINYISKWWWWDWMWHRTVSVRFEGKSLFCVFPRGTWWGKSKGDVKKHIKNI